MTIASAAAAPDAPAAAPGHGGAEAVAVPPGLGSPGGIPGGQGLPAVAGAAEGLALGERTTPGPDGEPSPGMALGKGRETGGDRAAAPAHPGIDQDLAGLAPGEADGTAPHEADLLTDFLPFDRAALEGAIDRFLDRFDGLASLPGLPRPSGLVRAALSVAGGLLAWDLALRLRRRARDEDPEADPADGFVRFPGLPDFRS